MTIEKIRDAYEAQPFRSFVIHLADGREIQVQHREFMALSPSGRTIIVYQPNDSHNVIDLLLVTDLEIGPTTNGRGRRKRQ